MNKKSVEDDTRTYSPLVYKLKRLKRRTKSFIGICKFRLTGVDEAPPEPEYAFDTLDRSSALDNDPKWIVNNTTGHISITGVGGNVWTLLKGSDPMLLTEEEYNEFVLSDDGKALELRGKIKIVDESFMRAEAFLADNRVG